MNVWVLERRLCLECTNYRLPFSALHAGVLLVFLSIGLLSVGGGLFKDFFACREYFLFCVL